MYFHKRHIMFLLLAIIFFFAGVGCKGDLSEGMVPAEQDKYEVLRQEMVEGQIISRNISDPLTIDAMRTVPRHRFVPESQKKSAYADHPLPIGEGQTISQPYVVALMTENLELEGEEKVLEIGTGSGYQAAVLAAIVDEVYTVEIITSLYESSKQALSSYADVFISNHDGYFGWEEHAPFDGIIVTAAPDHIPPPLVDQLAEGGVMVLPVGPPGLSQTLWKVQKTGGEVVTTKITDFVAFVPLTREIR